MAKIVGASSQNVLRKMQSDAQKQVKDSLERLNENIETLLSPQVKKKDFWDYLSIPSSISYSVIKGALDGIVSSVNSINLLITDVINNARNIFDNETFYEGAQDTGYLFTDFTADLLEGVSSTVVSTLGNVGRLVGINSEWAFGDNGAIQNISDGANVLRTSVYKDGLEESFNFSDEQKEENRKIVNDRYYKEQEEWIRGSVDVQNWISKNIVDNVANIASGMQKSRADEAFGDNELYNALVGTSQSIGNILASFAVAKIGSKAGLSAKQAQTLSTTYFASSVFGSSFQEALNNGASINDSYTYALGNAFIETAIENIGGFKTDGEVSHSLFNSLGKSTWKDIVKNSVEEGLEEVASGIGGTWLERYNNPENQITQQANADFYSNMFFSFMGGALSSMGLGVGRNVMLNKTAETRYNDIAKEFNKSVSLDGENVAVERFNKKLKSMVEYLNSDKTRGFVDNGNQGGYIGKMSLEDKQRFLKQNSLDNFITEKDGKFELSDEFKDKVNANMFKNKIGDTVVNDGEYAVNSVTRGVDISDNGFVNVLKTSELSDNGKKALEFANERNVKIAIFNDNSGSSYYGNNDVIYINENNLNDNNIEETILKHEMVHAISRKNEKGFKSIKKFVKNMVDLSFDKETKLPKVNYKDGAIKKALAGTKFEEKIVASFNDYLEQTKDVAKSSTLAEEEMVAYFIENILDGGNVIDILSMEDSKLFEKIKNRIDQNKELDKLAEGNKKLSRNLKKTRDKFEKSLKQTTAKRETLKFFVGNVLGVDFDSKDVYEDELLKSMFKEEFLKKHDVKFLLSEFFDNMDVEAKTTVIDGKTYNIYDVINPILENENIRPKRIEKPDIDKIRQLFTFNPENTKLYIKQLDKYVEAKENLLDSIDDKEERRQIKQDTRFADDVIKALNNNEKLTEAQLDLLREIISRNEYEKLDAKWRKENKKTEHLTGSAITFKALQKIIKYLDRNTSAYSGVFKNRTYSIDVSTPSAQWIDFAKTGNAEAEMDMHVKVLTTLIETKKYKGMYQVEGDFFDDGSFEILIYPTQEYIESEKAKIEAEEQKAEESGDVENVVVEETEQDKFKEVFDENIKEFLAQLDIEIEDTDITTIIPSFQDKQQIDDLTNAFDTATVVATILPSSWHKSYINHSQMPQDKKLVYSKPLGFKSFKISEKATQVKLVFQLWANKNYSKFKSFSDLRTTEPNISKHNDFKTLALNGQQDRYERAKDFNFDVAIYQRGNKDYNKLVKSYDELNPKGKYLLLKLNDAKALDVINTMNLEQLSETGSTPEKGFTTYDFIEEYIEAKKNVRMQRKNDVDLSKLSKENQETFNDILNNYKGDLSLNDLLVNNISKISIVEQNKVTHNVYDDRTRTMSIQKNAGKFIILHEIGHVLDDLVEIRQTTSVGNSTHFEFSSAVLQDRRNLSEYENLDKTIERFNSLVHLKGVPKEYRNLLAISREIFSDLFAMYYMNNENEIKVLEQYYPTITNVFKKFINEMNEKSNLRMKRIDNPETYLKDSKIRDKDGKLIDVYHGTNEVFEQFDNTKLSSTTESPDAKLGFHFSDNKGVLKVFGDNKKVFNLNIKKPLDFTNVTKKLTKDLDTVFNKIIPDEYDDTFDSDIEMVMSEILSDSDALVEFKNLFIQIPEILQELKNMGYDGFIFKLMETDRLTLKELGESTKGKEYVVFDHEQIVGYDDVDGVKQNPRLQQKNKVTDLTGEQKEDIRQLFSDDVVKEFFTVNKNGDYVLKNSKMNPKSIVKDEMQIGGKIYNSNAYGIHAHIDISSFNIDANVEGFKNNPLAVKDMNAKEKALHDFFKTTNINYILFRGNERTRGFSMTYLGTYVTFINTRGIEYALEHLNGTMIHETIHEMFKFNQLDALEYSKYFRDLLYTKNGNTIEPTEVFNKMNQVHYNNNFYGYIDGYRFNLKNHDDVYKILDKDFNNLSSRELNIINELSAQFTGAIFTDETVYKEVLKGKSSNMLPMFKIYTQMMNSTTVSNQTKKYFNLAFKGLGKLFDKFMSDMKKKYPTTTNKLFTLNDINTFIKDFTDGEFTTKASLLNAYFKEKAHNTRGNATNTIDNIIFASSQLAKNIQQGINTYKQLQEEFEAFKTQVELALNNVDQILLIDGKDGLTGKFKRIIKQIKLIQKTSAKGDLWGSSFLYELKFMLDDFYKHFKKLSDDTLKLFDIPTDENHDVFFAVDDLLSRVDDLIDEFHDGKKNPDITKFNEEVLLFVKSLGILGKKFDKTIFGKIKELHEINRKSGNKLLLNAFSRVDNTVNAIATSARQKEAPFNDELKNVIKVIKKIHDAIEKNGMDYDTLKTEVATILEELRTTINDSQNLLDTDGGKERIADLLYNEVRIIYEQFALLFNDMNFITDVNLYKHEPIYKVKTIQQIVKGGFNPNTVVGQLSKIIKEFTTEFETVFKKGMTLKEYASKIKGQISALANKRFKAKTKKLKQLSHIMTPQDFLKVYVEIFKGKIDFFEDFYNEYVDSAKRRLKIMHEFDVSYRDWDKKHKDYRERSLEKIKVSQDYLIQMRGNTDLKQIKDEVQKEFDEYKNEIDHLTKSIKEIEVELSVLSHDINEIVEKIKELKLKDQSDPAIINEIVTLESEKRKLVKERKDTREVKKQLKESLKKVKIDKKKIDLDNRIKLRLHDYVTENTYVVKNGDTVESIAKKHNMTEKDLRELNDLKPDDEVKEKQLLNVNKEVRQEITRGHLISLYLSVSREIEMQEMYENGNEQGINPTNHFAFANNIWVFDNEQMVNKGYQKAKDDAIAFTINANTKEELKSYLESLLDDKDLETIDFATQRFDRNYENVNEVFKAKYKVDLPKQSVYIPFTSLDSNPAREFKLEKANRFNIGVADGLVKSTSMGANTPLKIENIFGSIENSTREVANFSFERLITDFQNLLVNKEDRSDQFQDMITGRGNIFGEDNGIKDGINNALLGILRYRDITETKWNKMVRKVLRNGVVATVALNIPMAVKQFLSTSTISLKNKIKMHTLIKNISLSVASKNSKYRKYLMENNDMFYWRAQSGNVANLAEDITPAMYQRPLLKIRKAVEVLGAPVGWMDNSIIVGAFKSYADAIRQENPSLTEEQVLEQANEMLDDVMLFGVANTDSAFRSPFSNSTNTLEQIASKFQSENILQVSALIRNYYLALNKIKGTYDKFLRDSIAMLLSALFSAIVSTQFAKIRGYINEEDENFELIVNDFLWNNMVGALPYVNQLTSMVQFEKGGIKAGFEPQLPLYSDVWKMVEAIVSLQNGENIERKWLRVAESVSTTLGIPTKNATRLITSGSKIIADAGSDDALKMTRFFNSETKTQSFNKAIKDGNKQQINAYVDDMYDNVLVKNEIVGLLLRNPDERINIYDITYFRTLNDDGSYTKHELSQDIKDKYNTMAQKALNSIIKKSNYRKLDDKQKIKTLQRVINYYYNYMKAIVLNEKKEKDIDDINAVVERTIDYTLREIKKGV